MTAFMPTGFIAHDSAVAALLTLCCAVVLLGYAWRVHVPERQCEKLGVSADNWLKVLGNNQCVPSYDQVQFITFKDKKYVITSVL